MDIVDTCSMGKKKVEGAHKIIVESDKILGEIHSAKDYDSLVIPGYTCATNLRIMIELLNW